MNVALLLVPYDTARRGWRSGAGPGHLLDAGLADHLRRQGHSVDHLVIEDDPALPPAEIRTAFELCRRLAPAVREARAAGRFPLILSGNCNSAVGTLSGLTPAPRAVFWFDAHADCNTADTTATGFLDGTSLAAALGLTWRELGASVPGFEPVAAEATFLIGARDLDPPEAALLARSRITSVPVADVPGRFSRFSAEPSADGALGYLHLDLDVLDPALGQANSFPVPGGLSLEQVTRAIAAIGARWRLGAAAVTSYAPEYDSTGAVCRAAFAAIDAILASVLTRDRLSES